MAHRSSKAIFGLGLPRRPKLIFADGEKGGVGKSFQMRALAHTMLSRGADLVGFDADARNSHLDRYYGKTIQVSRLYLRERAGWNKLIDALTEIDDGIDVVIDLPANVGEVIAKEIARLMLACERLNRAVYRMWVIDSEYDSVAQLSASRNVFPLQRTAVVMNGLFGQPHEFDVWEGSKIQTELREAGGVEIHIPAMPPGIRNRISSARCSFADAAQLPLTLSEQIDLEWWLSHSEEAFEPLLEQLGV